MGWDFFTLTLEIFGSGAAEGWGWVMGVSNSGRWLVGSGIWEDGSGQPYPSTKCLLAVDLDIWCLDCLEMGPEDVDIFEYAIAFRTSSRYCFDHVAWHWY